MKHTEAVAIRAFAIAVSQQHALPEAQRNALQTRIRAELDRIGEPLETKADELHALGKSLPELQVPYQEAFDRLVSPSAQRTKSLKHLASDALHQSPDPSSNTAFPPQPPLEEPKTNDPPEDGDDRTAPEANIPVLIERLRSPDLILALASWFSPKLAREGND